MTWKVEFDNRARKELRKLDEESQKRILNWLRSNIATKRDPKRLGQPLKGRLKGMWRYKVGEYRLMCQIQSKKILVLILRIGHRRDVYQ
jgi:mRNA interferase RelE/StbE